MAHRNRFPNALRNRLRTRWRNWKAFDCRARSRGYLGGDCRPWCLVAALLPTPRRRGFQQSRKGQCALLVDRAREEKSYLDPAPWLHASCSTDKDRPASRSRALRRIRRQHAVAPQTVAPSGMPGPHKAIGSGRLHDTRAPKIGLKKSAIIETGKTHYPYSRSVAHGFLKIAPTFKASCGRRTRTKVGRPLCYSSRAKTRPRYASGTTASILPKARHWMNWWIGWMRLGWA